MISDARSPNAKLEAWRLGTKTISIPSYSLYCIITFMNNLEK